MADPKSSSSAVERFAQTAAASLADGSFVRLTLSAPVNAAESAGKILGRAIILKGVPHLSLTFRHATKDATKNIPASASEAWLREHLGTHYRSALLGTTKQDWQFISKAGEARLITHKPAAKQAPARTHDHAKTSLLDESAADWLRGLGVLDSEGKLRASMADKQRQIAHYLEILSHLAKECGWTERASGILPEEQNSQAGSAGGTHSSTLTLVDMGCGKGYLTFGAWHYFHRVCRLPVKVVGVEARADLVATTNKLVKQIKADGLEFVSGPIASAALPAMDALIALHACNTATDDAIRRGIELGAKLIIVAPCCHQELRSQLAIREPLAAVLRHGLMQERMAEWATDGLRALFLEWAGYRTKVMEFVAGEHTPKNLMIAAIGEHEPFQDGAARKRIEEFKTFFGIKHHALDALLVTGGIRR